MHCGKLCMQYNKAFVTIKWNSSIPTKSFVFLSFLSNSTSVLFEKRVEWCNWILIYHFEKKVVYIDQVLDALETATPQTRN